MESLVQVFYEWEIQLLVLLSFTLQMFLLFTGCFRRHSNNIFLRLSIWIAYLGADLVAVYALGYISRHEDATTTEKDKLRGTLPLAFFWAPFFLIHLGGPDTITAFAIEDNNLWLRHLLNLAVQVILVLYVFWKSIGWHSMKLIVPGMFLFLAGIIKYGERTWALMCGSVKSLQCSSGHQYKKKLPEIVDGDVGYSNIVCAALHSMEGVHNILAARSYYIITREGRRPSEEQVQHMQNIPKSMEIQLGMMYDDLYTKALVLRTRSGIILRCISQISAAVAFVLFFVSNKQKYNRVDIAITYLLFAGGFLLEVSAIFMMVVMSPWTWAWLKVRHYHRLAHMSMFLLSSNFGSCPEKRPMWSNSMGQYDLVISLAVRDKPRSCNQILVAVMIKMMCLVDADKEKLFWVSKLLDTEYVGVDKEVMECVVKGATRLSDEMKRPKSPTREWRTLGQLLGKTQGYFGEDFATTLLNMHVFTEVHLSKYHHADHHPHPAAAASASASDMEANYAAVQDQARMVELCRKLSCYMIHLLVNQASMLPLSASVEATVELFQDSVNKEIGDSSNIGKDAVLEGLDKLIKKRLCNDNYQPPLGKETLEEIKDVWVGLLLYAACKSRPEAHAAQLVRGGELLTFAWLLLAHHELGDSWGTRIVLTNHLGDHPVFHLLGRSSPQN